MIINKFYKYKENIQKEFIKESVKKKFFKFQEII